MIGTSLAPSLRVPSGFCAISAPSLRACTLAPGYPLTLLSASFGTRSLSCPSPRIPACGSIRRCCPRRWWTCRTCPSASARWRSSRSLPARPTAARASTLPASFAPRLWTPPPPPSHSRSAPNAPAPALAAPASIMLHDSPCAPCRTCCPGPLFPTPGAGARPADGGRCGVCR